MANSLNSVLIVGVACAAFSVGDPATPRADVPVPPVLLNIESTAQREGWTNVGSTAGAGVHVIAPMHDLHDFGNATVTAIYAAHVLGHASYGTLEFEETGTGAETAASSQPRASQLEHTLAEWHRVLKPGGALLVSTPDLQTLARLYLDETLEFAERFFVMRMMFGGQTTPEDFQRTGFDFETLALYLNSSGFCRLSRKSGAKGFGIFEGDASSAQFKGVPVSVNVVAYACKPGEAIEVSLDNDTDADDAVTMTNTGSRAASAANTQQVLEANTQQVLEANPGRGGVDSFASSGKP